MHSSGSNPISSSLSGITAQCGPFKRIFNDGQLWITCYLGTGLCTWAAFRPLPSYEFKQGAQRLDTVPLLLRHCHVLRERFAVDFCGFCEAVRKVQRMFD
jgi:hypothetical protein